MKKFISLFSAICMLFALAGCHRVGTAEKSGSESDTTASSAAQTESATSTYTGAQSENRPEAWAAAYPAIAQSLNEFYIIFNGNPSYYYFRNTVDLKDWVNTEFNLDGWYYYKGRIISSDGKWAIPENFPDLAVFETYTAEEYSGPVLSEEERTVEAGTVYASNSCTPFVLSGLRLDGDGSADKNNSELSLRDVRSDFSFGESIRFYIDGTNDFEGNENQLKNKLKVFCVPHRAAEDYKTMTAAQVSSVCAFENDYKDSSEIGSYNFENTVQADSGKGFVAGLYDILLYYEDTLAYYTVINIA